jgi:hypothetical protein
MIQVQGPRLGDTQRPTRTVLQDTGGGSGYNTSMKITVTLDLCQMLLIHCLHTLPAHGQGETLAMRLEFDL